MKCVQSTEKKAADWGFGMLKNDMLFGVGSYAPSLKKKLCGAFYQYLQSGAGPGQQPVGQDIGEYQSWIV